MGPALIDEYRIKVRCDVCGKEAEAELADTPPAGFATLTVRPDRGIGIVMHACARPCLVIGVHNLAEGLDPSAERKK